MRSREVACCRRLGSIALQIVTVPFQAKKEEEERRKKEKNVMAIEKVAACLKAPR